MLRRSSRCGLIFLSTTTNINNDPFDSFFTIVFFLDEVASSKLNLHG